MVVVFYVRPGAEERKMDGQSSFHGEALSAAAIPPRRTEIPKVLTALAASLDKRFSDFDKGIMESTRLADLSTWPVSFEDAQGIIKETICIQ